MEKSSIEEDNKKNILVLIPKTEEYMEYILDIIMKLPRIEKFSVGTEYKLSLYQLIESLMYLNKIENSKRIYYLNKIDANLNCQRIYLRIMYKHKWIDDKKFKIAIGKISELGKIVGGLIKHYAKHNTK